MMNRNYEKRVMGGWMVVMVLMIAVNVSAQMRRVHGTVIDAETSKPISSVNIEIKGERGSSGAGTDIVGYYAILGLRAGTYNMIFSCPGYKTKKVSGVEVVSGFYTKLDEMMIPTSIEGEVLEVDWKSEGGVLEVEPKRPKKDFFKIEKVSDPEPEMVSSEELEQTVIAAHMEVPITPGKNVIYCSTFQIAWNMLQDSIIKEDIMLEGDPEIVRMLNKQLSTTADISEECYVAMVDTLTQKFLDRINRALQEKFGENAPPMVEEEIIPKMTPIFSYAYLFKGFQFEHIFKVSRYPIHFKSGNDTIKVQSFEVESEDQRDQVSVLDYVDDDDFIISLRSKSVDDEIILAKISPQETLLASIQSVQERVENGSSSKVESYETVKIPKCDFFIDHSFKELLYRMFLNDGWTDYFISKAVQWTRFRLNEKGIVLKSEARIVMARGGKSYPAGVKPRRFIFNRPFLICLKQKNGRYPYFAMWVDNGELLLKWEE